MTTIQTIGELDTLTGASDMVLLYFGGRSCGVCRDLQPKIEKMMAAYPEVSLAKVEAEDSPLLAAHFSVFSVPAIILLIQGKETLREAGIVSLGQIGRKIARYWGLFYGGESPSEEKV